jgi:hypothetical protein
MCGILTTVILRPICHSIFNAVLGWTHSTIKILDWVQTPNHQQCVKSLHLYGAESVQILYTHKTHTHIHTTHLCFGHRRLDKARHFFINILLKCQENSGNDKWPRSNYWNQTTNITNRYFWERNLLGVFDQKQLQTLKEQRASMSRDSQESRSQTTQLAHACPQRIVREQGLTTLTDWRHCIISEGL